MKQSSNVNNQPGSTNNQPGSINNTNGLYERCLSQINREDNLINSRLTWFLTSQGLFLTAIELGSSNLLPKKGIFFLGIVISLITLVLGIIAVTSLVTLYKKWGRITSSINPPLFGKQKGGRWIYLNYVGPAISFPIFFIIFWIACFFIVKT